MMNGTENDRLGDAAPSGTTEVAGRRAAYGWTVGNTASTSGVDCGLLVASDCSPGLAFAARDWSRATATANGVLRPLKSPGPQRRGFGTLLRQFRHAAGLTREELAERACLSVRGIADLERGARRSPYPETLERLPGALGLDAAERADFAISG
jgi:hypothetical protein